MKIEDIIKVVLFEFALKRFDGNTSHDIINRTEAKKRNKRIHKLLIKEVIEL